MTRVSLITALVIACAPAEPPVTEEEALRYVAHFWHGIDAIDADTRERVRNSPTALAVYAELLSGERLTSRPVDTVVAIWWLAESDDPAFVPIFLRYAEEHRSQFLRGVAIYGLARHAARSDARARLIALTADSSRMIRLYLAQALMHVNDTNARGILRDVSRDGLGPRYSEMIRQVLAAPARREKGRFPCLPEQTLVAGRRGAFGCGPAARVRR